MFKRYFSVLLSLIVSSAVHADVKNPEYIKNFLKFEIVTYQVITEFNMLNQSEAGQDFAELRAVLKQGDDLAAKIETGTNHIVKSWQAYRDYSWAKRDASQGETDAYIFNDFRALQNDLTAIIESERKKLDFELVQRIEYTRLESILLLEQMSAEYVELSAAAFGLFAFTGERSVKIDARAAQFEANLNQLSSMLEKDKAATKKLKKAKLRWRFIKKTLLAYTDRSAPFVVVKTMKKIKEELLS